MANSACCRHERKSEFELPFHLVRRLWNYWEMMAALPVAAHSIAVWE
jgi:hypothetical protein